MTHNHQAEIKTALAGHEWADAIGLRRSSDAANIGDLLPRSHQFADGDPTGEMLPGSCCISIDRITDDAIAEALSAMEPYEGEYLYLVSGGCAGYGEDDGEVIISDATVIAAWIVGARIA